MTCFYTVNKVNYSTSLYIFNFYISLCSVVAEAVMESSAHVAAGGSINLTCSFTAKGRYSGLPFVVHWIRNSAENSTSVFSCHITSYYDGFGEHCAIGKDLQLRSKLSFTELNTHNLMISNATHSDSGQYLCALQMNINNQQRWAIMTNTTVIVGDPVSARPGKDMNLSSKIISSHFSGSNANYN